VRSFDQKVALLASEVIPTYNVRPSPHAWEFHGYHSFDELCGYGRR